MQNLSKILNTAILQFALWSVFCSIVLHRTYDAEKLSIALVGKGILAAFFMAAFYVAILALIRRIWK